MRAARLSLAAVRKFDRDNGFFLAAALAFGVLLSLIPIALLLLSLVGTVFSARADVADTVERYLSDLTPAVGPQIAGRFREVVADRTIAGAAGLVGLAWAGTMVFGSLRISLNAVFGVTRARGTLRGLAVDLLMLLLSGALLLASVLLTSGISLLERFGEVRGLAVGPQLAFLLKFLLPLLLTTVMSFMVLMIAPHRRMPAGPAAVAAVVTSLLWEAAKQLFGWYVMHLGRYSLVYGSVSTTAVFMLWLYYSAAIFLLGAELACVIEREEPGGAGLPVVERRSGGGRA